MLCTAKIRAAPCSRYSEREVGVSAAGEPVARDELEPAVQKHYARDEEEQGAKDYPFCLVSLVEVLLWKQMQLIVGVAKREVAVTEQSEQMGQ